MDIFDRVRDLAKRDKISISALEKKLGFSNKSLYPHTKDSTIRGDRVVALADYFGVSTDYLLRGKDAEFSQEERQLILVYRSMNEDGKEELTNYAVYLAAKAIYKKSDTAI